MKKIIKKITNLILFVLSINLSLNADNSGLINGESICYLNSVVQCLSNCIPLRARLLENQKKYEQNEVIKNFIQLINDLRNNTQAIKNQPFVDVAKIGSGAQDANEFLTKFLVNLHEEELNLFGIETEQAPLDYKTQLLLPIIDKNLNEILKYYKNTKSSEILIISLDRLEFNGSTKMISKNETPVYFPVDLEFNNKKYNLTGIVCHLSGHYYSYVKDFENKQWYSCDDTKVEPKTDDYIRLIAENGLDLQRSYTGSQSTPSILFYQLNTVENHNPKAQTHSPSKEWTMEHAKVEHTKEAVQYQGLNGGLSEEDAIAMLLAQTDTQVAQPKDQPCEQIISQLNAIGLQVPRSQVLAAINNGKRLEEIVNDILNQSPSSDQPQQPAPIPAQKHQAEALIERLQGAHTQLQKNQIFDIPIAQQAIVIFNDMLRNARSLYPTIQINSIPSEITNNTTKPAILSQYDQLIQQIRHVNTNH